MKKKIAKSEVIQNENFLNYKKFFWLWVNLGALFFLGALYLLHDPIGGPSGGTALGYTYGFLATAAIGYLMYYGIRKRTFYAKKTTLRGTLAAHVWIGIALIFLVPLHSGFSFGWNVHTLAYILMVIVIISGLWGAYLYQVLPKKFLSQRGGANVQELFEQIKEIESNVFRMIQPGIEHSDNLATVQFNTALLKLVHEVDFHVGMDLWNSVFGKRPKQIEKSVLAKLILKLPEDQREGAFSIIALINKKQELLAKIQTEARTKFWLRFWLYFHLPVSIALVVCVLIHIFSVFYYW